MDAVTVILVFLRISSNMLQIFVIMQTETKPYNISVLLSEGGPGDIAFVSRMFAPGSTGGWSTRADDRFLPDAGLIYFLPPETRS